MMVDLGKLLEPISPEKPSGVDLYYEKDFEIIKEARRQDDSAPRGLWELELKTADYKTVARLIEDLLVNKTKDLRLAAWLAEAWIYQEGSSGLLAGLQLLQGFLEKFWDTLYPLVDGDDSELRAAPLEWFGFYFDPPKGSSPKLALCRLPLAKGKFNFFAYTESRKVGYEADVKDSDARKKARLAQIAEGKVSAEAFDAAFDETPKAFYKQLASDYKQSLEELQKLDQLCREKFKNSAPSFLTLRKTLEEVSNAVQILLSRKLKTDPDPVEAPPPSEEQPNDAEAVASPGQTKSPSSAIDLSKLSGGAISTAEQATLHVLASAEFLRRNSPASPLSYLLLRALRWGEVRELGEIKSSELFAPSGDIRMALRAAAGAGNWKLVIDLAETAMSNFTGRGWLDLQRYSVRACDELGYTAAAKALRSELKCFLADFPLLPKAILDDDTGAANPETLAWLEKEGLLPKQ